MNLIYLWIEQYGEYFEKCGFTFTGKYEVAYNPENYSISIIKNERFVDGFWSEQIFDICAVVGENGTGKTMLANCLIELITGMVANSQPIKYFMVFEEVDGEINIYSNLKYINNISSTDQNIKVELKTEMPFEEFEYYKIAYFNNSLSRTDYKDKKHGYINDFSLGGLLRQHYTANNEMDYKIVDGSIIHNYYSKEFYKTIKFIYYFRAHDYMEIPFPLPKKIEIKVVDYEENAENTNKQINSMIDYNQQVKQIMNETNFHLSSVIYRISHQYKKNWVNQLLINLMLNIFKEIAIPQTATEKKGEEIVKFIKIFEQFEVNYINKYATLLELTEKYLKDISVRITEKVYYKDIVKKYSNLIVWLKKNEKYFLDKCNLEPVTCYIPTTSDNENIILELLEHYKNTSFPYAYFSFNCGLSSGEYNFLTIFSNIFSMFEDNSKVTETPVNITVTGNKSCKNTLLIFDEADLSLHPRWQQKYLLWMIQFTSLLFKRCKVQIIIATHSPIMLSDFPKDNVIYLDKKKELAVHNFRRDINTFGNNIHSLFLDSFFLNNEGTVGAFAEWKINKIVSEIRESKNCTDNDFNIKKTINYIGDDIVHKKLLELYERTFEKSSAGETKYVNSIDVIKETIHELQKQVKQLEDTIRNLEAVKNDKNTIDRS